MLYIADVPVEQLFDLIIRHIKSVRNPALASEHDGTWNKDLKHLLKS